MQSLDLNLLIALNALLAEESVTGAAEKLRLTPSALSRSLSRIRSALGDPVLVQAGRKLVPTLRALEIKPQIQALLQEAQTLFQPLSPLDPKKLERTFTIRSADFGVAFLGRALSKKIAGLAPKVILRFLAEGEEDVADLREGIVDLDIGVFSQDGPEIRTQKLFDDVYVGIARKDHPFLKRTMTVARFCEAEHLVVSRRGKIRVLIDKALAKQGQSRQVTRVVPYVMAAIWMCVDSDYVTMVPQCVADQFVSILPLKKFRLPIELPRITIAQSWHPRMDKDPAHRWLREQIQGIYVNGEGKFHRSEGLIK